MRLMINAEDINNEGGVVKSVLEPEWSKDWFSSLSPFKVIWLFQIKVFHLPNLLLRFVQFVIFDNKLNVNVRTWAALNSFNRIRVQ